MIQIGKVILFWMFLFLCSCTPSTLGDLRCEGEGQVRKLSEELAKIETKDDLQKAVPSLKKRFVKIAEVLVEVEKFPKEDGVESILAEQLFVELARIYEMPGGRELVESAQSDAIKILQNAKQEAL